MAPVRRFGTIGWWLGVATGGVALGLASAALVLALGQGSGAIVVGPWTTNLQFGSARADMYTRARVALFGLLANDKTETLYFRATTDSDGEPLSGDCTYVVEGEEISARWWSITAYGPDSFLIPNEPGVYSQSKTNAAREENGHFVIRVSAERQERAWLPVKAGERFDLTARLYDPDASVGDAPASAALPRISRESCR